MHFHKQKSTVNNSQYFIGDSPLISVRDTHRDLGVSIQINLDWSSHYDQIFSRAYRILGLIKHSFSKSGTVSTKKKLYTCHS